MTWATLATPTPGRISDQGLLESWNALIVASQTRLGYRPMMTGLIITFLILILTTAPGFYLKELNSILEASSGMRICGIPSSDPLFEPWARSHWPSQRILLSKKLGYMSSVLSDWNKHSFGNIFTELDRLKRHIAGIRATTSYHHSHFLHNLEREIQTKYSLKILQIEDFWAQRSTRVNWLTREDSKSRFFHLAAKIFHKKKKS